MARRTALASPSQRVPSRPRTRRWSSVNSLNRTTDGEGSPADSRSRTAQSSGQGAFDALQLRLQQAGGGVLGMELPYQVYLMLPYGMAIVALVVMARRAAYPQALMKPYRKGER